MEGQEVFVAYTAEGQREWLLLGNKPAAAGLKDSIKTAWRHRASTRIDLEHNSQVAELYFFFFYFKLDLCTVQHRLTE